MSENQDEKAGGRVTFTPKQLQELIAGAVSSAVEKANEQSASAFEKLANALIESRKPYVDPKQAENEENMRKQMREQTRKQKLLLERDQQVCEHKQGSNSLSMFTSPMGMSSIIHHTLDTGEVIGICTNCIKIIRWGDPDYTKLMNMRSGDVPSSAGRRFFADPVAAIKAGR